jgi:hypothetical protein
MAIVARFGGIDRCHKPLMRNLLRTDTPPSTAPAPERALPSTRERAPIPGASRKEFLMNPYKGICAAFLCLLIAGCSSGPQDLIVGKWQAADGGGDTVDFAKDGTVQFVVGGQTLSGKYKFEKGSVLKVPWDSPVRRDGLQEEASIQSVKVSRDELTMSDPGGRSGAFKRAG